MDNAYRCMKILKITDELISKIKDYICKIMLLRRELKLPVILSTHLFEDNIVRKKENIVGGLADKSEDHIEKAHQDGKRNKRMYCGL